MSNETQQPAPSTAIVPAPRVPVALGFDTDMGFDALQRAGKMLCLSQIVPEAFRGIDNIGSCCAAIEMAGRMKISPLAVMQSMYFVHGKPGWSAAFYISTFNMCGRFSAITYRFTGQKGTDSYGCVAVSTDLRSGDRIEGTEITIAMAKAEDWYGRKGSKWVTMPDQMLRYRAATFMIRATAPELTMGLSTREELEDIEEKDITPRRAARQEEPPQTPPSAVAASAKIEQSDGSTVETRPTMNTAPTSEAPAKRETTPAPATTKDVKIAMFKGEKGQVKWLRSDIARILGRQLNEGDDVNVSEIAKAINGLENQALRTAIDTQVASRMVAKPADEAESRVKDLARIYILAKECEFGSEEEYRNVVVAVTGQTSPGDCDDAQRATLITRLEALKSA